MAQLATTTLSAAIDAGGTSIPLASVADVRAGQVLFFDGEAVSVLRVGLVSAEVMRGQAGTEGARHEAGVTVYIGNGAQFYSHDPIGLPLAFPAVLPWINVPANRVWNVDDADEPTKWVLDQLGTVRVTEVLGPSAVYEGGGSYQPVAVDLEVAPDAGSDTGTDPKFLAPIMGNLLGDAQTNDSNYLAGVIGALSIPAPKASDYPVAPLMGVLFDGAEADAIVLADLDGDDNSGNVTTARAAFGVAMNNNVAGSGVDYGVDLAAPANPNYGGEPLPFTVRKAQLRGSDADFCLITGDGAPVNGTTGDDFAGKGSLYVDYTNGALYINTGTIEDSVWVQLAEVD